MKKKHLYTIIFLALPFLVYSQTKIASWPLEENLTPSFTEEGVVASEIKLSGLKLSNHPKIQSFVKNKGIAVAPEEDGSNWTLVAKNAPNGPFVDNQYLQFSVQIEKGKLNVKSIDLNSVMISSSGGRLAVVYSKSPDFNDPQNVTAVVVPNSLDPTQPLTTDGVGSRKNPISLTSVGSGITSAPNSAFSFILNGDKGVNISNKETLYVRIYANALIRVSSKYIILRNVSVNGELSNSSTSKKKKKK